MFTDQISALDYVGAKTKTFFSNLINWRRDFLIYAMYHLRELSLINLL